MATYSLERFRSEVLDGAGLARNNRFEVIIAPPRGLSDRGPESELASLYVEQASVPLLNIFAKPFKIFGPTYQRPITSEYGGEGMPITFHVDRDMRIRRFFEDWMHLIVDPVRFTVGYQENYISDIFSNVVYQDKINSNILVRTLDNVGKNKETYFRLIAAIPPGGKYFFVVGTQYNLSEYDGVYENKPLTFSRGSWRFFTFHQIKLFKETKININGFMLLRGLQNFYELETFGQLNISINQSFLNKKLVISLNANDILRTMVTQFSLQQGNVFTQGDRYGDNRRIGLNVRYAFGIQKKETRQSMIPNDFD